MDSELLKTQTDFSRGETSPTLEGRLDIDATYKGLKRCNNLIPKLEGGLKRREGFRFINTVDDTTSKFEVYTKGEAAYILLFQPLICHVYKDREYLGVSFDTDLDEEDINNLCYTQLAEYSIIVTGRKIRKITFIQEDIWSIEVAQFEDGPYLDENESNNYVTAETISDTATLTCTSATFLSGDVGKYVEIEEDSDKFLLLITAFVSATEVVVRVIENVLTEPDKTAKLSLVSTTLSVTNNVAIFDRYSVGNYVRTADNQWNLITSFTDTTEVEVDAAVTMASVGSLIGEPVRLYGRSIVIQVTADEALFTQGDVGTPFRMEFSYSQVWGTITTYQSELEVRVTSQTPLPLSFDDGRELRNSGRTKKYRKAAWSEDNGYPKLAFLYNDRLTFYGSNLQRNTFWASYSNKYLKMSPTNENSVVTNEHAITATFGSRRDATFLAGGKVIFLGTNKGIWQISPNYLSDSINPENIRGSLEDHSGAENNSFVFIESALVFIQKYGRKLRELYFSFNDQSYISNDLSLLSDHIFKEDRVVEVAYQSEPYSLVWARTSGGNLFTMTYSRKQQKIAWARHNVDGVVRAISGSENTSRSRDDIYILVSRNGVGSVEVSDPGTLLDSTSYSPSGLERFEGQSVWVVLDGKPYRQLPVVNGSVIVEEPYETIQVGINNSCDFQLHSPEIVTGEFSTTHGYNKRIISLTLKMVNAVSFSVLSNGQSNVFNRIYNGQDLSGTPVDEDIKVLVNSSSGMAPTVSVVNDIPTDLNVLAVTIDFKVAKP